MNAIDVAQYIKQLGPFIVIISLNSILSKKVNTVDCIFNSALLCVTFVLLSVPAGVMDTNINWILFAEIPLLFVQIQNSTDAQ